MPKFSLADEQFMFGLPQSVTLTALERSLDNKAESHRTYSATGGFGGVQTAIPGHAITAITKLVTANQGGVAITLPVNGAKLTQIGNSSFPCFLDVQKKIEQLNNTPRYEMVEFLAQTPAQTVRHPAFYRAMGAKYRVADSTHRSYFGIVKNMCLYWQETDWLPEGDTTVKQVLQTINHTVALSEFIIQKCTGGIAASSIRRFPAAFNHIVNFYNINNTVNKTTVEGIVVAMKKLWGKAPKPTAAIPQKILRFLLQYLKDTDFTMFCFFAFCLLCATRVSEILNLRQSDFTFSPASSDRKWVRIKFRHTKTYQSFKEDGHSVTFTEPKRRLEDEKGDKYRIDPFALAHFWYQEAYKNEERFIAPFTGSHSHRSRKLYKWFSDLKRDFQIFLKIIKKLDLNISLWRFHSIRTTYVGVMKRIGMSWEQIQVRTGHKWDSNVTRDTYFMNALLSEEFDDKFETLITNNLAAQEIFLLENEATDLEGLALDDQMHEEYYSSRAKKAAMSAVLSTPKKRVRKKSTRKKGIKKRIIPLGLHSKLTKRMLKKNAATVFRTPGKTGRKRFNTRRVKGAQRQIPINLTINRTHGSIKRTTQKSFVGRQRERPQGSPHVIRTLHRKVTKKISSSDKFANRNKGKILTPKNFPMKPVKLRALSPKLPPVSGCPWISSPQTARFEKLYCHVYEQSKHIVPHEDEWLPPSKMPRSSPTPKKVKKKKRRQKNKEKQNL